MAFLKEIEGQISPAFHPALLILIPAVLKKAGASENSRASFSSVYLAGTRQKAGMTSNF